MKKKLNFTRPIKYTEVFEIYKNIDPKTREVIREDGSRGPKMPDGGVRLRFLGPVPSWYEAREKVYQKEFGPLSYNDPNPIEHLIQKKDNMFGGIYILFDALYPQCNGGAYAGIGTATKKAEDPEKAGKDPFGAGTLTRLWRHLMKLLSRHESCHTQKPEYWFDHTNRRSDSLCDSDCSDISFSIWIDYSHTKQELEILEEALQVHRLGKYGEKFPINTHPASPLQIFGKLPI